MLPSFKTSFAMRILLMKIPSRRPPEQGAGEPGSHGVEQGMSLPHVIHAKLVAAVAGQVLDEVTIEGLVLLHRHDQGRVQVTHDVGMDHKAGVAPACGAVVEMLDSAFANPDLGFPDRA